MKWILNCVIIVFIIAYVEIGFAHSGFSYGPEKFEEFVPSEDGTSCPVGLYAQNFENTRGGAGIYSAAREEGKCAVIKTTANRGYTQMAYRYAVPIEEVMCFSLDICMSDYAVERAIQLRFGSSVSSSCNTVAFETDGRVMLGSGYISGLEWECDTWYQIKLTVNPVSGKVSIVLTDNNNTYKSQGVNTKTGGLYSIWLTNNGKADAVTYTDNWSIRSCIEPLDMEYSDNFNCYKNSIITGVSDCNAGSWSMSSSSGTVIYEEGVSEEKGSNLKMTTISTTNAQNFEYVLRNPNYANTIGYELSVMFEDFNTEKRLIIRDSSRNTLWLGSITKGGGLSWGSVKRPYVLESNKWYDIKITYNRVYGYSKIIIADGDDVKTYAAMTGTRDNVEYVGIANMAYSSMAHHGVKSVIYIDDFSVYNKNPSTIPVLDTTNVDSLDDLSNVGTTGAKTLLNGESVLMLSYGEYVKIANPENVTFTADVFMKSPAEADIKIGDSVILKISGGNLYSNGAGIGKICPWNWYRICITIEKENNVQYITLSDNGRLIAWTKGTASADGDLSVVCNGGAVFIDNIGSFESGKSISHIYTNPENKETKSTSFVEIVFPNFIDKSSLTAYVNGERRDINFVGDKTVRIENLDVNTYYHVLIENARDLYGNYLNSEIEFQTDYEAVDVQFGKKTLESGKVNVTIVTK